MAILHLQMLANKSQLSKAKPQKQSTFDSEYSEIGIPIVINQIQPMIPVEELLSSVSNCIKPTA